MKATAKNTVIVTDLDGTFLTSDGRPTYENPNLGAIEEYKTTVPARYGKLYDRICLESLAVRFLIIDLYGSQVYTAPELYAEKVAFKADCARLNYTKYSENRLITALWAEWKI